MTAKLYGYMIEHSILYFPDQRVLVNTQTGSSLFLRSTMNYLMEHILACGIKGFIRDDDILHNVWEKNGLSGTYSRLFQVMKGLENKVKAAGVNNDVFLRIKGKGYMLNRSIIVPLYTLNNEVDGWDI